MPWTSPTTRIEISTLRGESSRKGPPLRSSHPLHLAIPLIAALLLTACAAEAEPEPKFAPPEPSASPTAVADESPKKETVKQFLIRWAEAERDMQNTGETEFYLALSQGCAPCEAFAQDVTSFYENGGFIRTEAMEVERVERVRRSSNYRVWATMPSAEYRESSTDPEETTQGGPRLYEFSVSRTAETFNVTGLFERPR